MPTSEILPVPTHTANREALAVHESIIPLELHTDMGVFKIRIWRAEDTPFAISDPHDFAEVVQKFKEPLTAKTAVELRKQICEAIVSVGRVSAIEVLVAETRRGIVYYPTWP